MRIAAAAGELPEDRKFGSPQIPNMLNPLRSEPAERFSRSIDRLPAPGGAGGGGSGIVPPLWLTKDSDTEILVTFGQVNGITPTDVNTAIDISGSSTTWSIYMHATLGADGIPTAVEVVAATTGVPADDSSNAYRLIGAAVVAAGVITTVLPSMAWSQEFVTCGRDAADPGTTPGTYFWELA